MLDYKIHVENESMYNTPPCWSIYICGLVFAKLLKEGKQGRRVCRRYCMMMSKSLVTLA